MRRTQRFAPNLWLHGPTLEITIEPVLAVQELLRRDGEPIASAYVSALLDTGAFHTVIQSRPLAFLGQEPVGTVFLSTPSTTEVIRSDKYRVRLVFANGLAFETDVAEAPMGGQNVQCLIGRDILQHLVFTYNGPKQKFTLSFATVD